MLDKMESKHIGYKKCRNNRIVVLEIIGENNEERQDIVDKDCAMMRCSKARVLDIYDMNNKMTKYECAYGIHDSHFIYRTDNIIEPDSFNTNLDEVYTNGIHYFLTEEPAYFWDYDPSNGILKVWYDNGQIMEICHFKDGLENGLYEKWYKNGNIKKRLVYEDGVCDGLYETFYENGYLKKSGIYTKLDRNRRGLHQRFYPNGKIHKICLYDETGNRIFCITMYEDGTQLKLRRNYRNGIENGLHEEWYPNGNMYVRYIVCDGKINGLYERWYEYGQINIRSTYVDGVLDGRYEEWKFVSGVLESSVMIFEGGKPVGKPQIWSPNILLKY